ncbi:MAG TPA: PBP1A family penicillin-binding protein [Acidimicrobiales bacterium]|nr:PBP1A family penicillin-binding protein [Acidimicrobiales bacterium]
MRALLRFFVVCFVAGAGLALGLLLLVPEIRGIAAAADVGRGEGLLQLSELSERSVVYDVHGNVMSVFHAEENRSPVPLDRVPDHVVNAILDVEDDRFWAHGGVDLRSTMRALVTNVQSGEVRQGGSTITQQLVKNALLTPEKSVDRKVREAVLAVRLEDELSKEEILERYLNTVYFGNGAYGVQAAAEKYWAKDVEQLTPADAALLAGTIRNPVGYDPVRYPEQAKARRSLALDRMVANGHLDATEAAELREAPLPAKLQVPPPPPNDYFVEEVKQRLLDDPRLGETAQERNNAVFRGGLHIHTTFDPAKQEAAQEAVKRRLPNTRGRFTAALASVEPGTGAVRGIVAGDDFNKESYNLATQGKRQPGSSFKIFVLLAAFEAGYGPNDIIDGTGPCTIKLPGFAPYTPGNYEGSAGSVSSLTEATAKSLNCAYARLGAHIGLQKVVDMTEKLGIPKGRIEALPSMTLGSEEATPLEMAAAFAAIANDGVYHTPRFVEKLTDRTGKVVFEGPDKGRRAFSVQVARMAAQSMRAVVERGTGTRARLPGRQAAGKTGTSQNHENAWFVGFTPQLSTAVWMGNPDGNVAMNGVSPCGSVTGGCIPSMIWNAYMSAVLEGQPSVPFAPPDPRQIPRSRTIRDRFSSRSGSTSTTRPTARTVPPVGPTVPEPGPEPEPEPTTTTSPPTTKPPKPTTTTEPPPPTTAPPEGGGG